jgi:histidinol phosphatase-like PHP family hydrolase
MKPVGGKKKERYGIVLTMLQQDLHIHTTFSTSDNAVVPEQTPSLVAAVKHAIIVGISDHFEYLVNGSFEDYEKEIRQLGLKVGVEVDGHPWVDEAANYNVDYYIFHCRDQIADYRSIDKLLTTGKPVIIAHPNALQTNLNHVPAECLIEINNRYIWRNDWKQYYGPFTNQFKFVIGSDAHQPNWLSQAIAHYVAAQLGIEEHLVF